MALPSEHVTPSSPILSAVPVEMLEAVRWICWRDDKIPSSATTGGNVDPLKRVNWRSVSAALKAVDHKRLAGVGFVTGEGFAVVDLDRCRDAATGALKPWAAEVVDLCDSYTEVSPSGRGLHIWLLVEGANVGGFADITSQDMDADGGKIEVFTAKKYATVTGDALEGAPRSLAPAGKHLAALRQRFFTVDQLERSQRPTPPPATPTTPARPVGAADRDAKARKWLDHYVAHPVGGRNDTGHAVALQWRDDVRLSEAEAEPYMLDYQRHVERSGDHAYTPAEALATLRSVYSRAPREEALSTGRPGVVTPLRPRRPAPAPADALEGADGDALEPPGGGASFRLTDLGNSERLAARCGDRLRYVSKWHKWLVWDGRRWAVDDTGHALQLAKETVRAIYQEAADTADDMERAGLVKHAVKSESERSLRAMLALAEPDLAITPDDLDADPWLFNVQNGTVNLRTGALQPHQRGDYLTRLAPVTFDPSASAPTFDRFLTRIFAGDAELIAFVQRAAGYTLTGDTREHALFLNVGGGRNGKSTLLEALGALMADYATQAVATTFLARGNANPDAPRNDLAALKGARLVTAVETAEGARLDESLIKQATGGDKINARFLHGEYFQFRPAFKLWLATNHKPTIRGTDDGIWSRVRLIPFAVRIPDDEQDKTLPAKLEAELAGILNWLIVGCLAWQRDGLGTAQAVTQATGAYRAEQDVLAAFLTERCVTHPRARIMVKELYAAYAEWAEEVGERTLPKRHFNQRLEERGYISERGHANQLFWQRIGLRYVPETPPDGDASSENGAVTLVTLVTENQGNSHESENIEITSDSDNQSNQSNPVDTLRADTLLQAEAHGWRSVRCGPMTVGEGEQIWRRVVANNPADTLAQILAALEAGEQSA